MTENTHPRRRPGRVSRRQFVGLAVAGLGGTLTGCSALATTGDPLESMTVEGAMLRVTLAEHSRIDEVALLSPDGSPFVARQVDSATEVSLPLVERGYTSTPNHYRPGEHTVVARREERRVGERTLSLAPTVEIDDMRLGSGAPFNPTVTLENAGTGPTLLTYLGFENAPNPTPPPDETTGLETDSGRGVLLPPGRRDVRSGSIPFAFRRLPDQAADLSCPGHRAIEVVAETVHGDTVTETFDVRFEGELRNVLWLSHRCTEVTVDGNHN